MSKLFYSVLSLVGFVGMGLYIYFDLTYHYLLYAPWSEKLVLEIFPIGWIEVFGHSQVANPVAWFHYVLAWTYIPAFVIVFHQETRRLPLSLFLISCYACFIGAGFIVPFVLALRSSTQPRAAVQVQTTDRLLQLYLFVNLGLLLLWSELAKRAALPENSYSNYGTYVIVVVGLQALVMPVVYALLAHGKLVVIKPSSLLFCAILSAASCLSGFLKAVRSTAHIPPPMDCSDSVWPLSLVSAGFSQLASSQPWFALALHDGWSSVMALDSFLLVATALVYIGTETAPSVPTFIRRICFALTLLVPTGPIGLILFVMIKNS